MKALIKYLPIEEKPKEGDYISDVKRVLRVHKFFAVTHNIKAGDVITDISKPILHTTVGPLYSYTIIGKFFCYLWNLFEIRRVKNTPLLDDLITRRIANGDFLENYKGWFKILGEVSLEATFVEDGKEYEVQGIKKFTGNTEPCGNTVSHEYKLIFEVKCPCCGDFK